MDEPLVKRAVSFVDGQNLFHCVRETFGYTYSNFDVQALSRAVCERLGWQLVQARFYTGVPDAQDDAVWHHFWTAKLLTMRRCGVWVYSRSLRYRTRRIQLPDGTEHTFVAGEEKGIDVRIAIDIIRMAHHREFDVALVFSQDQDLSEVAGEVRLIAVEQTRWIKMASAFPKAPTSRNRRGINKTDWIPVERSLYDSCLDSRDYRPKP